MSGSYLYWGYATFLLLLSLLYTFLTFFYSKSFIKVAFFRSFSFIYIILVILCLMLWGIDDNTYLTYLIVPLFSYNYFKLTTFLDFKEKWLDITAVISLWSIISFSLFIFDIFDPQTIMMGDHKFDLLFGINIRASESRLCGVSFEPGVFQILLIYTLLMWVKNIRFWYFTNLTKIKLLICVVALLTTQSTMGYLGLIVVFGAIVASGGYVKRHFQKVIVLFMLFLPLTYIIYTSSIVQDKLNESDGNESYSIRIIDTMASWRMIEDSPILGNGIGKRWANIAESYGNITNSNGVLNMISRLGVFWIVFYSYYAIKSCRKNRYDIIPIYYVLAVLIPLLNEDIAYTPLAFIFVSEFKKYPRNKLIQNVQ